MTARTLPSLPLIAHDLVKILKWFALVWGALVVVVAGIIAVTATLYHPPTSSILDGSLNAPRYWGLVTGVFVTYGGLPQYVAAGLTRRRFAINAAIVSAAAAVMAGVLTTISLYVEGLFYDAQGWHHKLTQPHLFTSSDQVATALLEFTLVFGTYFFAGWMIGSAFYRWRLWAIPLAVVGYGLALATEAALGTGWIASTLNNTVGKVHGSMPLAVVVGVVAMAAMAVTNWGLVRDVPIASRRT
ncbi:MAG TPA: hypothetical protein VE172_00595 [Stackebrandtia sp.]|uniref:hypothetical protein n=1 Tax=Stackebrandtia sp. TaxID=2023065 RepID=UPI002D5F04FA|nr:hypothetical protein [Stackebrandtia sp.]HZE37287.1 hypothetical protein [Stackebrandtia sp.]